MSARFVMWGMIPRLVLHNTSKDTLEACCNMGWSNILQRIQCLLWWFLVVITERLFSLTVGILYTHRFCNDMRPLKPPSGSVVSLFEEISLRDPNKVRTQSRTMLTAFFLCSEKSWLMLVSNHLYISTAWSAEHTSWHTCHTCKHKQSDLYYAIPCSAYV